MGHWGVKSYENDDAGDALDAGFACVHGKAYEDMMDDDNPLTPEQVQAKLANIATLNAALEALNADVDLPVEEWDDVAKLAYVGIVIRHVELEVPLPIATRDRAREFLQNEDIDWEEVTMRKLRRDKELRLLDDAKLSTP